MKFRYICVPASSNLVLGTNNEEVFQEWQREFEEDDVIVIDLAAMKFLSFAEDAAFEIIWQDIQECK